MVGIGVWVTSNGGDLLSRLLRRFESVKRFIGDRGIIGLGRVGLIWSGLVGGAVSGV